MQPYFLPYLGYFQLLAHSDAFVLLDDVQFIKRRWINRNRILVNGTAHWLTLPVREAPSELPINRREYRLDRVIIDKILRRIGAAYRKAPHFAAVFPLLQELLDFQDPNVAAFNTNALGNVAAALGIATPLTPSSAICNVSLPGQERIIEICRRLGARDYLNPIGGVGLYQADRFAGAGLSLRFLRPTIEPYRQFEGVPVADLSVLDALMFNNADELARLLQSCRIEPGPQSRASLRQPG